MDVAPFDPGRSAAAIASSRRRIAASHQRIRASRVLTRPLQGGAGGSGPTVSPIDLRRRIREMIAAGHLPPLRDSRSWIGQGHGAPCMLCAQIITRDHWEHEVEIAPFGEIRVHGVCFRMWREESAQRRKIA